MKIRTLLAACAATTLIAGSANSAIVLDGSSSFEGDGVFDASGSDKLVVVVTGEHGNPGWVGDVSSVTYDGLELTQAVNRDAVPGTGEDPSTSSTDQTFNDIWYLDNPATSGGAIDITVGTRAVVSVFALSGTAPGVGNTAISDPESKSVELTTSADSFVIASHGMGGDDNTANVNEVDADAPLTEATALAQGSNWNGHVTGYATADAGTNTYSFTGGNTVGTHTIAAEFNIIPEPSSLALLGLGGLLIARRRRG